MRINVKPLPFILAYSARPAALPRLVRSGFAAARGCCSGNSSLRPNGDVPIPEPTLVPTPLIYAVDDLPGITELYRTVLAASGYSVRTFNERTLALGALQAEPERPRLLITDYLGIVIPVDRFILACRALHPDLRVLMVSGLERADMRLSGGRPDAFLQKPFTPLELQQQVEAALGR